MATISSGLTRAIVGLPDVFSKRAWPLVQVLLAAAILAVAQRTDSAVLHVMGWSQEPQFQKYHQVLNRVKWSTLSASRRLLTLLIEATVTPMSDHCPSSGDLDTSRERARACFQALCCWHLWPCMDEFRFKCRLTRHFTTNTAF